jgi:ADP-dependent phosphofructokinase/glucokinase
MTKDKLVSIWKEKYQSTRHSLENLKKLDGVISGFNSNIDAVLHVDGKWIENWVRTLNFKEYEIFSPSKKSIHSKADFFRGIIHCFIHGIAEEWLIKDDSIYHWIKDHIGYDSLQVGGQAGIIANTSAICEIPSVYVHCASLHQSQSELFLNVDNLISFDEQSTPMKVASIHRANDIPLIHWIIEFSKGDSFILFGDTYTCPKANRFIATYDPLNFELAIDDHFVDGIMNLNQNIDFIILSGFHMLTKNLDSGQSGFERMNESLKIIQQWKCKYPQSILHLELASTQDKEIRKYIIDYVCPKVDSLGCNEMELIDILDILHEEQLAETCRASKTADVLFDGMLKVFERTSCDRIQLHMFGIYITIAKKSYQIPPLHQLQGMILASSLAASKAGTGTIYLKENLSWSFGKEIGDAGIHELTRLESHLKKHDESTTLSTSGIFEGETFDVICTPTIIVENPVTLVGMGDTISSLSLFGSKIKSE